ncbi:protein NCBP2AS2 homolog [Tubulanus polymorphus]|uniref:protein NCBP2AS2 homolog n=1 Tax=Tubulanus polymorphus TaxID=672921 RepID=UPI003DA50096
MPLRFLARYLANQPQLIQKLSESYPIRRAAQLTAYFYFRGRAVGEETLRQLMRDTRKLRDSGRNDQVSNVGKISNEFRDILDKINRWQRKGR